MKKYFPTIQPLLLKAVTMLKGKNIATGIAIDFGVGGGEETHYLLKSGYHVIAIDNFEEFLTELPLHTRNQPYLDRLTTILSSFEELTWDALQPVDLFVALYSLGFVQPESFHEVWNNIVSKIKPEGYFVGIMYTHLIKNKQEQGYFIEETSHIPFMTEGEIRDLFKEFTLEYFDYDYKIHATQEYPIDQTRSCFAIIAKKNNFHKTNESPYQNPST